MVIVTHSADYLIDTLYNLGKFKSQSEDVMKNSRKLAAITLQALIALPIFGQQVGSWTKEEKTDALRDTRYVQFMLEGQYLTPPRNVAPDAKPAIIVRCASGSFTRGHLHGKFLNGYIYVGTVVNAQATSSGTTIPVQFRLDGGKLQSANWSHSTDYSSIFFQDIDFNTMLYGHFMPHKENTSPPVKKIVIGTSEYLGGEIVMQFDLPDPTDIAETCAAIWHK